MRAPHLSMLLAILVAALAGVALPARAAAEDAPRVFLDEEKKLGITWRLPGSRWKEDVSVGASDDRLASVERQSGGMTVSASVHRRLIPKMKDPREGRPDPLQTATDLVGCQAGMNPRPDLGRHDVFELPGIKAAYAVGEFKMTEPHGRTLALVFVRDADYLWLEASGAAKVLDDATVDELRASLQATPFADTDPRVFFEDKDLGVAWRLPSKRWFGQGKAVGLRDRLAAAQRGADGMAIEAWLYRGAHPKTGRPDPYEEARRLCTSSPHARFKQVFEPGGWKIVNISGLRGAYSIGEAKDATPPLRTVAVVVVRETDSVWLIAWGHAKLLDDATAAELAASLAVDAAAKPGGPPR